MQRGQGGRGGRGSAGRGAVGGGGQGVPTWPGPSMAPLTPPLRAGAQPGGTMPRSAVCRRGETALGAKGGGSGRGGTGGMPCPALLMGISAGRWHSSRCCLLGGGIAAPSRPHPCTRDVPQGGSGPHGVRMGGSTPSLWCVYGGVRSPWSFGRALGPTASQAGGRSHMGQCTLVGSHTDPRVGRVPYGHTHRDEAL